MGGIKGDSQARKTAIIAVTSHGARLARVVATQLEEADIFLPARLQDEKENNAIYYRPPLSSLVLNLFSSYGKLVFFCALGAVVRMIAPLLRGKADDPAVVVVDERGWNVISLLSGHAGGANRLAIQVAEVLGANPVITTASDLHGVPALDELCRERGWRIENPRLLASLTTAVMEGEEVAVCSDAAAELEEVLGVNFRGFRFLPLEDLAQLPRETWKVAITDRLLPEVVLSGKVLLIRPRRLVAGLGFHRGIGPNKLWECLERALAMAGLSMNGVGALATIDTKGKERGIRELSERLEAELVLLSAQELEGITVPSPPSEHARKWAKVPGVCEQAALAAARGGRLLVRKSRFEGVTVAVAERPWSPGTERGKLSLVGLGPGDPDLLPPRARRALFRSDVVIGYSGYLQRVSGLLGTAECRSYGMGQEAPRLLEAISLARRGKKVCLVSGGDPGIYGMAAVLGDLLLSGQVDIRGLDVEIIPGIPAHCAAASLLGSPLACDFAVISLSDHLVEKERILARVEACAASDLVIVLYNPASSLRRRILSEAAESILKYRPPDVPVALVRNAWREGESVRITTLGKLGETEADMHTLVLVGNSETGLAGNWMATRRGYGRREGVERSEVVL
jgi:cobalt-precorrin 5A hydrolase/precorrin-3B C17-methyltransferase